MLIFPEGTRSENGQLLAFKRGAFKLALSVAPQSSPAIFKAVIILSKKIT